MGSNPTAPMVREANRGAVIPTAGGERGLGQGRVCGGASFGPPLPQDLCQILSKRRDCALTRTCIGPRLPQDLCHILSKRRDCTLRALAFTALNQPSLPRMGLAFIGIACGRFSEYNFLMSLHRSLRSGGSTAAKRNVLKRFERVTLLKKRGQWKAGMKSTGLPKTKPE